MSITIIMNKQQINEKISIIEKEISLFPAEDQKRFMSKIRVCKRFLVKFDRDPERHTRNLKREFKNLESSIRGHKDFIRQTSK